MTAPIHHPAPAQNKQNKSKPPAHDKRSRSKRLRHTWEWRLLRGLMAFVRLGDIESAYKRLHGLSWPLRKVLRSEWYWTLFNLKLVYGPHITETQRYRLATIAFENMIRSHLDGMRIGDFQCGTQEHKQQLQPLSEAFSLGRGVILCAVHLGSWEVGLKTLASLGFPTHVVYRHANNPLSEQAFIEIRAPYGVQWIRRDDPRRIMRTLREKKLLLLMTDINQRQDGIPAPFLGVPAMCPAGAARLAGRFQCPLVPAVCLREGPGRVRFLATAAIEPLSGCQNDLKAQIAMTTQINRSLEPWIHTYAEQYNWLHARWRTRPDGSLWQRMHTKQESSRMLASLDMARTSPYPVLSERVQQLLA